MKKLNLKEHGQKGILITFCGLDGCGKSTMIRMLEEKLKSLGFDVVLTKQPTDMMRKTDIFRTYMDAEDHSNYEYRSLSLMAAADRIQHSNKVILPALAQNIVVISDRYFYSCLANLRARGYKKDKWIYEIAESIPKPDIAFFLDTSVDVAVSRVRERPEEKDRYIDMALQHALYDEYKAICAECGGILIPSENNIPETFEKIFEHVKNILEVTKMNDIEIKVLDMLKELALADIESVDKKLIDDLSFDSLRMVMLLILIEEKFGIELEESDINPFALITVKDVIDLVNKYVGNKEDN